MLNLHSFHQLACSNARAFLAVLDTEDSLRCGAFVFGRFLTESVEANIFWLIVFYFKTNNSSYAAVLKANCKNLTFKALSIKKFFFFIYFLHFQLINQKALQIKDILSIFLSFHYFYLFLIHLSFFFFFTHNDNF